MISLANQRCFNHATREAVARCPECKQFFCRECITEHDDRVVCASCLKKLTHRPLVERFRLRGLLLVVQCVFSLLVAWYFFFLIGHNLLKLPSSFHEGTLWQADPTNPQ
jgi:hypothetical protein